MSKNGQPRKVVGVKPTGSSILVEILTPKEALGTFIEVTGGDMDDSKKSAPQAYVVDVGPGLEEASGIKKGDRVVLNVTSIMPVPNHENSGRTRGIVEFHNIKAILEEE